MSLHFVLILGLNAYHGDSAACILCDGQLIAAAEEERFRRIKHWAGLPTQAISYCLDEAGARLSDVAHIAINRNPKVNNLRRLGFVLTHRPQAGLVFNRIRNLRKASTLESALGAAFPNQRVAGTVHQVEHHLAHLASAFLVSKFEEAVCLSIDGFGDFASSAWGLGRGHDIEIDGRVYFPHSLGIFYSTITQFIGFPNFGDEYKVMGLAPYGRPKFLEPMRQMVSFRADGSFRLNLKFFRHHTHNVAYQWNDCAPEIGMLFTDALEELLGPARKPGESLDQRHRDLARSAQELYEEALFSLLNALHRRYQSPNLALAGGCAMNSVANGKVYLKTPFKQMYLPAAAGDAGGAIGAAFVVWNQLQASPSSNGRFLMRHAFTGPQFGDDAIATLLRARNLLSSVLRAASATAAASESDPCSISASGDFLVLHLRNAEQLCRRTAEAIAAGQVVGWFQGRMEWGPRALGNRSILSDPRRSDMKDTLNAKIKRRESFRPFAPSVLREHVRDWFEQDDDVPFMMQVFQVREEKRNLVPATTHVDGSGRLQTVHKETNPLYHQLISSFHKLTSVPMVLNTSFNENEPVVCRPEEALDCFLRTKMDVLVLGSYFIERPAQKQKAEISKVENID